MSGVDELKARNPSVERPAGFHAYKDANAFYMLAATRQALYEAKWAPADVERVLNLAKSGDYDHLVATCEGVFHE